MVDRNAFAEEFFFTSVLLYDHSPEPGDIDQWTDAELQAAVHWAHQEYLSRQPDTGVSPPVKPVFLQRFK